MAMDTGGRVRVAAVLKRILVGRSKPTHSLESSRLPKVLALPIFASDALSSNAYATEQILVVLLLVSAESRHLVLPIAMAIAALLVVVVASYAQACRAYPGGGGGYMVSKDNLGRIPSLVAAGALLVDLVLTVAVSVVAGTVAIVSFVPSLLPNAVPISIGFVVLLTLANLRGVRETGALFAFPTYAFIFAMFATIGIGLFHCTFGGCPQAAPVPPLPGLARESSALGLFVVLHAFSSGSTALTGVEAIATAVPAFQRPQASNAQKTLMIMGIISVTLFLGISYLATHGSVTVSAHRSVVAQIAHAVHGGGLGFLLVQVFTTAILVLAANTSFQAFPRLLAILARDRFVPRQFSNLGDRLVFSNGVIVLAVAASLLIWAFSANLDRLIQLYVVGVFTDFTLSQTGLVRRWLRLRRRGSELARRWKARVTINSVGAVCTATVLVITVITKFREGAWIVIVTIPLIVALLAAVNRHYQRVRERLLLGLVSTRMEADNHVVLLVPDLGPATAEALGYIRSFRPPNLRAVFLPNGERADPEDVRERWRDFVRAPVPLDVLPERNGNSVDRLRGYLRGIPRSERDFVTVVLPELIDERSMLYLLRRRDLIRLKSGLLRERGIVVTDVPVVRERGELSGVDGRALVPPRTVALVLISGVNDATARAVNYAKSLQAAETRALYFVLDRGGLEEIQEQWFERGFDIRLDLVDAPFRDLTAPLLDEVRRFSSRQDTVVAVVMPELLVKHWWQAPLHNQTALFVKRELLFEPRVILSSVPYRWE
jgi:amino acid transporter